MLKRACGAIAAVLALGLGGPAGAVVATSIKIKSGKPGGDWLQIGELQVFAGGVNIALASGGATVSGSGYYGSAVPAYATDGVVSTNYPDIYHSDGAGPTEYLEVKFTGAFDISDIVIYGRGDCCSERNLFKYELYNFGRYGSVLVAEGALDARGPSHSARAALPHAPVAAVPEPGAWALMIMGFGAAGAVVRRRRAARA
ncbi:MAG: PEPxxWA-CTERM sorting domain-containing protein [Pseudomonadota bacterium]